MVFLRRYLIAGLLVWLPIWVTLLVLKFIVGILNSIFTLLPTAYQPSNLFNGHIPGAAIIVSLLIILLTGVLVTNFFGHRLFVYAEKLIDRIPFIRSIYSGTKQLTHSLFSSNSNSFRKVVLIEYPRKGCWSVGFLTGAVIEDIERNIQTEMATIFIPTTPNPTSGFLVMVPKNEMTELNITIDQALKLIISLGVVQPVNPDNTSTSSTNL